MQFSGSIKSLSQNNFKALIFFFKKIGTNLQFSSGCCTIFQNHSVYYATNIEPSDVLINSREYLFSIFLFFFLKILFVPDLPGPWVCSVYPILNEPCKTSSSSAVAVLLPAVQRWLCYPSAVRVARATAPGSHVVAREVR